MKTDGEDGMEAGVQINILSIMCVCLMHADIKMVSL